jgi:hypothetical protein
MKKWNTVYVVRIKFVEEAKATDGVHFFIQLTKASMAMKYVTVRERMVSI